MTDQDSTLENQPVLPFNPELHQMEEYFNARLSTDPSKSMGISKSVDGWGNQVYTSRNKAEDTMAGEKPATLIASSEGKELVSSNPGLLKNILTGDIPFEGIEFHSGIYPIELNTKRGKEKFVLKYMHYEKEEDIKSHMSGIQAMRIMQMASREQPVPNLTYAVPMLATHDFTLTPFIFDGLSLGNFLAYFHGDSDKESRNVIENEWSHAPEAVNILRTLKERYTEPDVEEFISAIRDETNWVSKSFDEWIDKTIESNPEFVEYKMGSDLVLDQYIIDMKRIMALFERYKKESDDWRVGDEFSSELMKILGVVELAHGMEEKEFPSFILPLERS